MAATRALHSKPRPASERDRLSSVVTSGQNLRAKEATDWSLFEPSQELHQELGPLACSSRPSVALANKLAGRRTKFNVRRTRQVGAALEDSAQNCARVAHAALNWSQRETMRPFDRCRRSIGRQLRALIQLRPIVVVVSATALCLPLLRCPPLSLLLFQAPPHTNDNNWPRSFSSAPLQRKARQ